MTRFRSALMLLTAATLVVPAASSACAQDDGQAYGIGQFLCETLETKRSLQRSDRFLDVDRVDRQLQVALVLDGTQGMEADLADLRDSLQGFVKSLQDVKGDPIPIVSIALVLYRDRDSTSGAVQPVVGRFETNLDAIKTAIDGLRFEVAAPSPDRAVDRALHQVLSDLNWLPAAEEGISRWVILAGDTPPNPAQREHATEDIIAMAKTKQVAIYGLTSGSAQAVDSSRAEFTRLTVDLARATGGRTMGTLEQDAAAVKYWMTDLQQMAPITDADVDALRSGGRGDAEAALPPRIAVLPHKPLKSINFEPSDESVVIATHLRSQLSRLGGIDVAGPAEIKQCFAGIDAGSGRTDAALQTLGQALNADYLIWGTQRSFRGLLVTETGLYDAADGRLIVRVNESIKPTSNDQRRHMVGMLFQKLCSKSAEALASRMKMAHAAVFARPTSGSQLEQELAAPLAHDYRAQSSLLAAQDLLEQSLAYARSIDVDVPSAEELLRGAIGHLEEALTVEPESPYAHLLLADCYHNLMRQADAEESEKVSEHLELANACLNHLPSEADPIRQEIMAQHSLLVVHDVDSAVRHYRELAGRTVGQGGRFDLRAHWMLAGIHLGDWGAASYGWDHVDTAQSRQHILAILANWPDSPEARFYQDSIDMSSRDSLEVAIGDAQLAQSY